MNTYVANLNNILQGSPFENFSSRIINETESGYFDIITQLSSTVYSNDGLSKTIET